MSGVHKVETEPDMTIIIISIALRMLGSVAQAAIRHRKRSMNWSVFLPYKHLQAFAD